MVMDFQNDRLVAVQHGAVEFPSNGLEKFVFRRSLDVRTADKKGQCEISHLAKMLRCHILFSTTRDAVNSRGPTPAAVELTVNGGAGEKGWQV